MLAPASYRFGPFEADLRKSELTRDGIRLRLERKPWQLLLALLERPGELVTRAELEKRLWGEGVFVDFEHGLNVAVKKVRQVLCDTPEEPRYVETVSGQGYRFVAMVTPIFAPKPVVEVVLPPVPPRIVPQRWWAFGIAIGSAVVTLAIVLLIAARSASVQPPSVERLTSSGVFAGAISPDGRYLVYRALNGDGLWLQQLGTGEVRRLETQPKLSPWHLAWYSDGSAFLATNLDGVWRVPAFGGIAQRLYGRAGQASPSPDGAHITLKTFGTGDDIWVTDGNGANARLVAKRQPGETLSRAVWSPHGKRLAYIRHWRDLASPEGVRVDIETVRPDGSDVRVAVAQLRVQQLIWLADGRLLFGVENPKPNGGTANVWAVAVNEETGAASHPEALTNWPDFNFGLPSATADGRTVAFTRQLSYGNVYVADLAPGARTMSGLRPLTSDSAILFNSPTTWDPATADIVFSVSGATKREVVLRRGLDDSPAHAAVPASELDQKDARFSADGRWLLWLRLSAEHNSAEVLTMPRDGGPVAVLDRQPGSDFALSCPARSGAECVFAARQPDGSVFRAEAPDIHSSRELFRSTGIGVAIGSFEVAPGGNQLLTCASANGGDDTLLLVDLPSGKNITEVPFRCDATEWTSLPDGSGWLVTRWTGLGGTEVLRVDASGAIKILWKGEWLGGPVVSPDGRHVAFESGNSERNIWALHF